MKKTFITLLILAGLSFPAKAETKADMCLAFGKMAIKVVEYRDTIPMETSIEMLNGVMDFQDSKLNYLTGVVGIAYITDLSPLDYGKAVMVNCMETL